MMDTMMYDISPPVSPRLQVWPGDTPPSREVLLDLKKGDHLTLSSLHASVHLGAHADAPSHYGRDAPTVERLSLHDYVGPCQVLRVRAPARSEIRPQDLTGEVTETRILVATESFPDPEAWNEDFAALHADLIEFLAARGVRLVGVDTPSVDLFDSRELPVHDACLRHSVGILEGLVLRDVPAGRYELIALPLRLVGFDASPVRAVLRAPGESRQPERFSPKEEESRPNEG